MNVPATAGEGLTRLEHDRPTSMSDTSAPFGAVVSTQRRFIDGAIEAQRSLSRGGLRLTRRSATAVVGIVPDDEDRAAERLDEFFDGIASAQDDVFDGLQDAIGGGLDRVEGTTGEAVDAAADVAEGVGAELEDATETVESGVEGAVGAADGAAESPSVETLSGIGSTYAGRLSEAGLGTVAALASASADTAADAAQVGESRASEWIEAARDLNES
jgi:predicted flap endonuclease-1-like 5' DNA nuclease